MTETYKDVIHTWYPIYVTRMEKLHYPHCAECDIVSFFETIELAQKVEAKKEAEKEIIIRDVSEAADD